ncbi:MAG: hypothetical protein U5K53_00025 [Halanaerobiales bacterium]|nr:hypothetical protein [Halanaerobiales bacterium]
MKIKKILLSIIMVSLILITSISNISAENPFKAGVSVKYTHSSNNRLDVSGYSVVEVVNIGKLEVRKIKRDILSTNFKLSYFKPEYSVEVVIPYIYQRESIIKYADTTEEGEPTEELNYANGLGDVMLNFQKSIFSNNQHLNFGIKTTTGNSNNSNINFGTGHYGVKIGYSHFKQNDPVVFFGSINYFHNIENNGVNPGDTINYSVGAAYALTQTLSINTRLEHSITSSLYQNDNKIIGSNINSAKLYLNTSYVNNNSELDFSLGIGLTEDSPDFSIQINKPYYF